MKITINPDLKPAGPERLAAMTNKLSTFDSLMKQEMEGGKATIVHFGIGASTSCITHASYTEYLGYCWAEHWKAVLSPDIFRHIILCQVGQLVTKLPEVFRSLFTDSDEKQEILLQGVGPKYPLAALAEVFGKKLRMSTRPWLSPFSTSDGNAIEANIVALAQAASPFYNYSMYLCGIPAVYLNGDQKDWRLLQELMNELFTELTGCVAADDLRGKLTEWWSGIIVTLAEIIAILGEANGNELDQCNIAIARRAREFFTDMFRLVRCGSGSDVEVEGWITKLYLEAPSTRYPRNYALNVGFMDYRDLSANKDYRMYSGLLASEFTGATLVPSFSSVILEKHATPAS